MIVYRWKHTYILYLENLHLLAIDCN